MTDLALHLLRFDQGISPALEFPVKEIPQQRNTLHSPQVGAHHGIKPFDFTKYRELLEEVLDVRLQCGKNEFPTAFMSKHLPSQWGGYTGKWPRFFTNAGITADNVHSCEDAVRMDSPLDLGIFIMRWLRDEGRLKPKAGTNHTPFLETWPQGLNKLSEYVSDALQKCFEVKYYHGVARPEQVFEHLYNQKRSNIVSYLAPIHPSYAAGHSAAAAATARFFYEYFDLDTQDWIDIRFGAYLFGMFRTMAGVHYAVDNLAGFQIGGLDVGYSVKQS